MKDSAAFKFLEKMKNEFPKGDAPCLISIKYYDESKSLRFARAVTKKSLEFEKIDEILHAYRDIPSDILAVLISSNSKPEFQHIFRRI